MIAHHQALQMRRAVVTGARKPGLWRSLGAVPLPSQVRRQGSSLNARPRRQQGAAQLSAAATASCSSECHPSKGEREYGPARQTMIRSCVGVLISIAAAVVKFLQRGNPPESQAERQMRGQQDQMKGAARTYRMASVMLPFAAAGLELGDTTFLMTKAVGSFMKTYLLLLFLRVLLSWFPAFNWERQPWLTLRQMTDPYLQLFRGIIPPFMGLIDFTPLLGFFCLQWIAGLLQGITIEDDLEPLW